jgi:adenylosuccinate synthase
MTLTEEINALVAKGIDVSGLRISQNAHVILPYHRDLDMHEETARGKAKIGTTGRGVGPCYADKASRVGIRMGDIINAARLRERLEQIIPLKNAILKHVFQADTYTVDAIIKQLGTVTATLAPYICDTQALAHDLMDAGSKILFEGAQATMLDLDGGTYPFVTSSHPISGGATIGTGIPPTAISQVLGVVKAYTTRVGSGTFPTELLDERGDRIRERGHEYGTTTGRPRRCGWLDAFALKHSVRVNGLTGIHIGHLDVLAGFAEVQICTGYTRGGAALARFPSGDVQLLDGCEPMFETLPGWDEAGVENATTYDELPTNAKAYVARVQELAGVPARFVSVGPGREQTFQLPDSPSAADLFSI